MFSLTERIMPPTYAGQTWGVSELSSRQNPMFSKAKKEQQPANTCSGNLTPRFDNRSKYSNDIRAFELFRTIMKWTKNSISMMAQQMGEQNAPSGPLPLGKRERERGPRRTYVEFEAKARMELARSHGSEGQQRLTGWMF